MAKGQVPREAVQGIKLGRMTTLREVTTKTIAQQLGPAVKAATARTKIHHPPELGASASHMPSKASQNLTQKPQSPPSMASAQMTPYLGGPCFVWVGQSGRGALGTSVCAVVL